MTQAPANPTATDPREGPREGPVRSVSLVSLGCPKNTVDSEKMLGLLAESGLEIVSDGAGDADAVVVNTCGFLEDSKTESLGVIHEALEKKKAGAVKRVVVAGCLVQRHRAKILDWAPGVDAIIGVFDRDRVVSAVTGERPHARTSRTRPPRPTGSHASALTAAKDRGVDTVGLTVSGKDGKGLGYFERDDAASASPRATTPTSASPRAAIRTARSAPSPRSAERCAPSPRTASLAKRESSSRRRLRAQHDRPGHHQLRRRRRHRGRGLASGEGLPKLLDDVNDAIAREAGAGWARLMYAYPTTFSDEMIDAIADLPHVLPYIDIPLQHASNMMLSAMRRNVTREEQTELLHKLRDRVPGMAIRTTFITGFPGETEDDHEQLLQFIEEVGFDMLGVFQYSAEPGTPAGRMEADPALRVDAETKARREREIMTLQQSIAFEQAEFLAEQFDSQDPENSGVVLDVLIDEPGETADDGLHESTGRAYFQAPSIDSVTTVRSKQPARPRRARPLRDHRRRRLRPRRHPARRPQTQRSLEHTSRVSEQTPRASEHASRISEQTPLVRRRRSAPSPLRRRGEGRVRGSSLLGARVNAGGRRTPRAAGVMNQRHSARSPPIDDDAA